MMKRLSSIALVLLALASIAAAACPCQNRGTCVSGTCICAKNTFGPSCESCVAGWDIKTKCISPVDPCNDGPRPFVSTCAKKGAGWGCKYRVNAQRRNTPYCTCRAGYELKGRKCVSVCETGLPCADKNSVCVEAPSTTAGYDCPCKNVYFTATRDDNGVVNKCTCGKGSNHFNTTCDACLCNPKYPGICDDGLAGTGACACPGSQFSDKTCIKCKQNYDPATNCETLVNPCVTTTGVDSAAAAECKAKGVGWTCDYSTPPGTWGNVAFCKCAEGFKLDAFGKCIDINECELDTTLCSDLVGGRCVNTPGGYECDCKPRFIKSVDAATNATTCACDVGSGYFGANCEACVCGPGTCLDGPAGNGTCICPSQWRGSICQSCTTNYDLLKKCTQLVNPCLATPPPVDCSGDPNSVCDYEVVKDASLPNLAKCVCKPGYALVNGVCTDIDECSLSPNGCAFVFGFTGRRRTAVTTCVNSVGSYNCTCPAGYSEDSLDANEVVSSCIKA